MCINLLNLLASKVLGGFFMLIIVDKFNQEVYGG